MAASRTPTIKELIDAQIAAYEQSRSNVFRISGYSEYKDKTKILEALKADLQKFYESGYNLDLSNPTSTAATCAAAAATEASDKTPARRSDDLLSKLIGYMEKAYLLNNYRRTNIRILLDNIFKILVGFLVKKLHEKDHSVYRAADNFLDHKIEFQGFFKYEDYLSYYIDIAHAYDDNPYKEFHQRKGEVTRRLYNYSLRAYRTTNVVFTGNLITVGLASTAVIGITKLFEHSLPREQQTYLSTNPAFATQAMEKEKTASRLLRLIDNSFRMSLLTETNNKDCYSNQGDYVFFATLQAIRIILNDYETYVTKDANSELRSIMTDMRLLVLNAIGKAPENIREAILLKHPSIRNELNSCQHDSDHGVELSEMKRPSTEPGNFK